MAFGLTPKHGALPVLGSMAPDAISLGRYATLEGKVLKKMRYEGDQHILVFGPNGKGKGTRVLMPNLLQSSGSSIVVVDPKGELAAVTAEHRRKLGRVVILNPFGVLAQRPGYSDLKSDGFNPLARLDPTAESFNVEAARLADAMVTIEGTDPHWTQSARSLIAALIMFAAIEKRQPAFGEEFRPAPPLTGRDTRAPLGTVARIRELLCLPSDGKHKGNEFMGAGLPRLADLMAKANHYGLKNKAAQFTEYTREVQSIASAAKIQTEAFDDPEIARDLGRNNFNFADLKREPITVYLILPPDMMARHAKWLRLVLTAAI